MLSPPFGPGSGSQISPGKPLRPATCPRAATPHPRNGACLGSLGVPRTQGLRVRPFIDHAGEPGEEPSRPLPPNCWGVGVPRPRPRDPLPARWEHVSSRPRHPRISMILEISGLRRISCMRLHPLGKLTDSKTISCDGLFSRIPGSRVCDYPRGGCRRLSARGGSPSIVADPAPTPSGKKGCQRLSPSLEGVEVDAEGCPPRPEKLGQLVSEPLLPLPPGSH